MDPAALRLREDAEQQLVSALRLFKSPDWSIWVNFLKRERRAFLQDKVNTAVREGELQKAQVALALRDDCLRQIELFGAHVKSLESKPEEKGVENGNKI